MFFSFYPKCIGIRLDHETPLRCEITCCNGTLHVLRARAPKVVLFSANPLLNHRFWEGIQIYITEGHLLVGGFGTFFIFPWRTHIFQRGRSTTNRISKTSFSFHLNLPSLLNISEGLKSPTRYLVIFDLFDHFRFLMWGTGRAGFTGWEFVVLGIPLVEAAEQGE